MTDRTPRIDERTMQDLVDGAKRLIPQFCPEWTNHGPADPGMALIEVFAWMTDQVLQKLNDVPDQLYDALLHLIGLDTFPAVVAQVDMVFYANDILDGPLMIPAGTVVGTSSADGLDGIDFQTQHDAYLRPAKFDSAITTGLDDFVIDCFEDLQSGVSDVSVFEPLEPGSAMLLGFPQSCSNLVLRLDVDAEVAGIGINPRDAPIIWETWSDEAWLPANVLADSTGGLTRSGDLIIAIGDKHEPRSIGTHRAHWLRVRLLPSNASQPSYSASPRLRSVKTTTLGVRTTATQSSPMATEYLGTADGSPGLFFRTSRSPVLPLMEEETVVVDDELWTQVADFSESGADDCHYTFASDTGTVRFGPRVHHPDGSVVSHGRVPRDGSKVTISGYRVGGGAQGNVGAETITTLRTEIPSISRVVNPLAAFGGSDAETIENARLRAPLWIQTGDRAVTAADFERIAQWADPNVARALCVEMGDRQVRLAIVPRLGVDSLQPSLDDLAMSAEVFERVRSGLDERRLLGTTVEVGTPNYHGVSVVAMVSTRPGRSADQVQMRCLDALGRYLHPVVGGSDGNGWPFGRPVDAIALVPVLSAVDGVDQVIEVLLFDADVRNLTRYGLAQNRINLEQLSLPLLFLPEVVVQ